MPENNDQNHISGTEKPWWQPALMLFVHLSVWIAIPVVLATFLGQWLDDRFSMKPWLTISTVGLAFIVSMFGIVKEANKEYKRINNNKK